MKKIVSFLTLSLSISTTTTPGQQIYWAIFGPMDVSTQTVVASTTTVSQPIILKAASGDCYTLQVNANGMLFTNWLKCQ